MQVPIFMSYPKPFLKVQEEFIQSLCAYLKERGLTPRTLGVSDYDMDAPLAGIRRLMTQTCGLLAVGLRRSYVQEIKIRPGANINGETETKLEGAWLTSPYAQIEPAMAFQLGMPILIFREEGVISDGVLEPGVTGLQSATFDLANGVPNFQDAVWAHRLQQWEMRVRQVHDRRGQPPALY